ncbi:hypothetical protein GCM10023155_28860 [Bremerella cremea]
MPDGAPSTALCYHTEVTTEMIEIIVQRDGIAEVVDGVSNASDSRN